MPKIRIVVKDGKVHADFMGYKGDACTADAKKILEALKSHDVKADVRRKSEDTGTGVRV